jgi:hypothetical protein
MSSVVISGDTSGAITLSAPAVAGTTTLTLPATTGTVLNDATVGVCRAWVNFNGTGTVAIRASFNVSSITDNGTGNYTVNFTTAMSDADYSAVMTAETAISAGSFYDLMGVVNGGRAAGSVRITCVNPTDGVNERDPTAAMVAVFR